MVMLYYPWTNEQEELLIDSVVRKTFSDNATIILERHARYNSLSLEELERLQKEVDESLQPYRDLEIEEFQKLEEEGAFIQKVDVFKELGIDMKNKSDQNPKANVENYTLTRPMKIEEKDIFENFRILNEKQYEFAQHIYHLVKTKKEHEPFPKIVLLGAAGTGKSLLLRVIYQLLTHYYDRIRGENPDDAKVLLAAYTGIAAFLIGGNTCHNAFALKIGYKGKSLDSDSTKNTIRAAHRSVKAIIIDELSFISKQTRNDIDKNCRKIYGNESESFGGKLVIFMGDLFQLPPVCGQPIYKTMKNTKSTKFCNGKNLMADIESDRVWEEFKFFELTEIVRQKDAKYQTALNNLAR
jgi:energy-coupling factor transporter ATP-binding protein EcfA2